MSTAKKILTNTIAQFAGKITVGLLSIVAIKLLTRYLTQNQYGEYNFIYDFLAIFGIIADLGLYTVAVREMSKDESHIDILLGNILTIRTFVGIIAMIGAITAGFLMPIFMPEQNDPSLSYGIAIASVTVLLALLNGTLTTVLQVRYQMKVSAYALVIGKILSIGYIAYAVLYGFRNNPAEGFYHVVGAGIIGNLAMLLATVWYVRQSTRIMFRFDWTLIKHVFIKALPYGIALVLSTIYFRLNTILLKFFIGPQEVALYAVGMRLVESLTIISLYFMNSVLPILTKSIEKKDGRHQSLIQHAFDFLAALGLPLITGGFVLAYPIVAVISDPKYLSRIGEGFYGSDIGLQILLIAMACSFLNTLFAFVLISVNQQKQLLWINIGAIALNIVLNSFVIPRYGFRGAAATSVFAEAYILVATAITARRHLVFHVRLKNFFKIIFASLAMAGCVYLARDSLYTLMQNKNLIVLIPIGGVAYTLALWSTGVLNKNMLQMIFKKQPPETLPESQITQ